MIGNGGPRRELFWKSRKLKTYRQILRNEGTLPFDVFVEELRRYVLKPGDEMLILASAPETDKGFKVVWLEQGLLVYAPDDQDPRVRINGRPGIEATPSTDIP